MIHILVPKEVLKQVLDAMKYAYNDCESDYVQDEKLDPAMNKIQALLDAPCEPVAWLNPWRGDQVTTDYDAYGKHGVPLYAPKENHEKLR
jgi:hypothetical protein